MDANNIAGFAIAPNGSGLAVGVGTVGGGGAPPNALDVINVSNPGNTAAFLTRYMLPARPASVAIGSGIAFIANGTAGLQVVNYRSFDNLGVPPTIFLTNSFLMLNTTNGIAEEGKSVSVAAITTDDVQVRDVEFYLDGEKQLTDVSFPFEYRFVTPSRTISKTNFTLQAKATDTGGNTTWSPLITVALVPDATPPRVSNTFPLAYGFLGSVDTLAAYFNEPIQTATLNPITVRLVAFGADNLPGTADDVVITNGVITYRSDVNAVILSFPTNLASGGYQVAISPPIADLAGNAMAKSYAWQFYVLGGADSDHDGIPDSVEIALGLNPSNPSTYNDGILDGNRDLNGDGLRVSWKIRYGYDPLKHDSFNDGILDKDRDPDADGLTNLQEQNYGTDPFKIDTDGDGWSDDAEITVGSNPLDPNSRPSQLAIAKPPLAISLPRLVTDTNSAGATYVTKPPVQLVLPSPDGAGAAGGVWVAMPPTSISLSGIMNDANAAGATYVAQPPVQLVLPALEAGPNAGSGTTVAQPPVRIQFLPP